VDANHEEGWVTFHSSKWSLFKQQPQNFTYEI